MYNKDAVIKYRKTHKDKINTYNESYMPQYYMENKEKIKEYDRLKYIKNKDNILIRQKRKYEFKKEWGFLLDIDIS